MCALLCIRYSLSSIKWSSMLKSKDTVNVHMYIGDVCHCCFYGMVSLGVYVLSCWFSSLILWCRWQCLLSTVTNTAHSIVVPNGCVLSLSQMKQNRICDGAGSAPNPFRMLVIHIYVLLKVLFPAWCHTRTLHLVWPSAIQVCYCFHISASEYSLTVFSFFSVQVRCCNYSICYTFCFNTLSCTLMTFLHIWHLYILVVL